MHMHHGVKWSAAGWCSDTVCHHSSETLASSAKFFDLTLDLRVIWIFDLVTDGGFCLVASYPHKAKKMISLFSTLFFWELLVGLELPMRDPEDIEYVHLDTALQLCFILN